MLVKELRFNILRISSMKMILKTKPNQVSSLNQFYSHSFRMTLLNSSNSFFSTKNTKKQSHQFDQNSNYYEVLNIQTSATQEQIKQAYLSMVKKHHPDLSKEQNASEKFQLIQKAYEILSDPQKRSAYRATLRIPNPETYQQADQIREKYTKFSRKEVVPDEWQFSYKLFKKHYEQVDAKQKEYEKFVGQGDQYYVHKNELKTSPTTYIQQISMIAGSICIAAGTMYYMWG